MVRTFKQRSSLFLCAAALGVAGLSSGCAESATAVGAAQAAQATVDVLGSIPAWVQQAAQTTMSSNALDWGKPEMVIETDTSYVLLYPTTPAQRKKNKGIPRMIVIMRSDAPANTL